MSEKIFAQAGDVQVFKLKPTNVEAIQFTGLNGRQVVEFVKNVGGEARNGGKYVKVSRPGLDAVTLRKGDIVVFDFSQITIYDLESFKSSFTISKHHVLI